MHHGSPIILQFNQSKFIIMRLGGFSTDSRKIGLKLTWNCYYISWFEFSLNHYKLCYTTYLFSPSHTNPVIFHIRLIIFQRFLYLPISGGSRMSEISLSPKCVRFLSWVNPSGSLHWKNIILRIGHIYLKGNMTQIHKKISDNIPGS